MMYLASSHPFGQGLVADPPFRSDSRSFSTSPLKLPTGPTTISSFRWFLKKTLWPTLSSFPTTGGRRMSFGIPTYFVAFYGGL